MANSMTANHLAALEAGQSGVGNADWWLEDPADEAVALLARQKVRECADLSRTYGASASAFLADLLDTPSAPFLNLAPPSAPNRLVQGEEGMVRIVVTNVGATTAIDVSLSLAADSMQLEILDPATILRDSLVAGDSLAIAWRVRMLLPTATKDSVTVVVSSLHATAPDAYGNIAPVFIANGPRTTGVESETAPFTTGISAIAPNPSSGRQFFELRIAPGQPARSLELFSIQGQRLWKRALDGLGPGLHRLGWDGRLRNGGSAPPGVYFLRLVGDRGSQTRKFVRIGS